MSAANARSPRAALDAATGRCSRSRRRARLLVAITCVLVAPRALAQIPRSGPRPDLPGMERGNIGPGEGPLHPFLPEDWEYWWYLHAESELDLRQRLAQNEVPGSYTDYKALTPADRTAIEEALTTVLPRAAGPLRARVLLALAKSGNGDHLDSLFSSWDDNSLEARRAATLAVGVLGDPSAAGALEHRLRDDDEAAESRFLAALGLGLLGAVAPLERALDTDFFQRLPAMVQSGIVHAAGLAEDAKLGAALRTLHASRALDHAVVRAYAMGALGRIDDDGSRQVLEAALLDPATQVRRAAALAYGRSLDKSQDANAVATLFAAIDAENDSAVRNFQHIALGRIGGDRALSKLAGALGPGRSGVVRGGLVRPNFQLSRNTLGTFAALGMGLSGDDRALSFLLKQLREESRAETKGALVVALGLLGRAEASKGLISELRGVRDPRLRAHLALACGMCGATKSSSTLARILREEEDIRLVPATAMGLALLGERTEAVEILTTRLRRERSSQDRATLLYALSRIGDRSVVELGIDAITRKRESEAARGYAAVLLGELLDRRARRRLADLGADFDYTAEPTLLQWLFLYL